ncbi:hypothetical protein C7974DRAFT_381621 [Boeremia exigua]|uniref:uncharacterized protein n=1 Tax=Boeremia exigua TaxID=749465 RepID=UPI001E8CD08D|nr:uncharacterized protein C7974DRAFT_381621 [Boeremia exigua]KAH6611685.1 hypothetical protein C7974DRAFT_381621 [Boeremia exigua]
MHMDEWQAICTYTERPLKPLSRLHSTTQRLAPASSCSPATAASNAAPGRTIHAIATNVQLNTRAREDARNAAKEAVEVDKANLQMARQIKSAGPKEGGALSYAAMEARSATLAGTSDTQVTRTAPMQTQREVVVTIRDPSTVLSPRAMNPRNLNAHVERYPHPDHFISQDTDFRFSLPYH